MLFLAGSRGTMVRAYLLANSIILVASTTLGSTIDVPEDYSAIQRAIVAAANGDTIRVAPGTYHENIDFLGKAIRVLGTDGPDVTILDGNQLGSVVMFQQGEGPDSVLEGFSIVNGAGTVPSFTNVTYGGGIFCLVSSPTIRSNVIRDNGAWLGGGIAVWAASPVIEENLIVHNTSTAMGGSGGGGGIHCEEDSSPWITRNVIRENQTDGSGGGIAVLLCRPVMIRFNEIRENSGRRGSGIWVIRSDDFVISENHFVGNSTSAAVAIDVATGLITRNHFERNTAGVSCVAAAPIIHRNTVLENGAGIGVDRSSARISGNRIQRNNTGVSLTWDMSIVTENVITDNATGVRIHLSDNDSIRNNTIAGNLVGVFSTLAQPVIDNSIIWGNLSAEITVFPDPRVPTLHDCNVRGGWSGPGGNNIDVPPGFVDADGGDFHLRLGSPCVDRGDSSSVDSPGDIEGDRRVTDGDRDGIDQVDLGADELRPDLAVRYGTVNAGSGYLDDVLFLNGSRGNRERIYRVSRNSSLTLEVRSPMAGPASASFVLYAWLAEPDDTTIAPQPQGLGWMGFSTPLTGNPFPPVVIWNNSGHAARLGCPTAPSSPAPSMVFDLPSGGGFRGEVTFQGFIEDHGSAASVPGSITNAIVLKVE